MRGIQGERALQCVELRFVTPQRAQRSCQAQPIGQMTGSQDDNLLQQTQAAAASPVLRSGELARAAHSVACRFCRCIIVSIQSAACPRQTRHMFAVPFAFGLYPAHAPLQCGVEASAVCH